MSTCQPVSFSVVIPTYNYAERLPNAVRSVISQSSIPELVLVDDGSTDDTPERIRDLQETYGAAVMSIRQDNAGPGAARNAGARMASGEWLVFLDADDELMPGAIAALEQAAAIAPDADLLIGDHLSVSNGVTRLRRTRAPNPDRYQAFKDFLIRRTLAVHNGACAIRKAAFDRYEFPVTFRHGEDIALFAKLLASHTAKHVSHALVRRHHHPGSLRTDVTSFRRTALDVVEDVFSSPAVPDSFQRMRRPFLARRLLSLSRQLYDAGDLTESVAQYKAAFLTHPLTALRGSYKYKALRAAYLLLRQR